MDDGSTPTYDEATPRPTPTTTYVIVAIAVLLALAGLAVCGGVWYGVKWYGALKEPMDEPPPEERGGSLSVEEIPADYDSQDPDAPTLKGK